MKLSDISNYLESFAPLDLQESYDNSGLLIGNPETELNGVLICLDLTMDVLEEAIQEGLNMIISHHPLIFSGLKSLTGKNELERIVLKAIKEDISIYAMHTNLDNISKGVNAMLCEKLGILDPTILQALSGKLNKLVTFCPDEHAGKLREALFSAGAGHIGNYDSCSYNTDGYGTFRGGVNTNPFVGEKGKLHTEKESRIELILPDHLIGRVVNVLKREHPYEEVAYDIYPLKNEYAMAGAGMIGELAVAEDELEFLKKIKKILGTGALRHSALLGRKIKKVAVCGGSGSFLIRNAISLGADIFITGDIKYHQFFETDGKMLIVDAGHFETEQFTKELIYKLLNEKFPTFALRISQVNTNAVRYL